MSKVVDVRKIKPLAKRHGIASLSIFGSRARGTARVSSDIDMLVRFAEPKSLIDLMRIEKDFSRLFKKPVDLVTEEALSPYIKKQILREARRVI